MVKCYTVVRIRSWTTSARTGDTSESKSVIRYAIERVPICLRYLIYRTNPEPFGANHGRYRDEQHKYTFISQQINPIDGYESPHLQSVEPSPTDAAPIQGEIVDTMQMQMIELPGTPISNAEP